VSGRRRSYLSERKCISKNLKNRASRKKRIVELAEALGKRSKGWE